MDEKILKEMNANLEEIWHKLIDIDHWIMQISEYGMFSSEVEDAIVAIGRALNKDFDAKYTAMENAEPYVFKSGKK